MLEGKNVHLRIVEKEDLPLLADWSNNPEYLGEYVWLPQQSRAEWERRYDNLPPDTKWFFIEKKDGTKIGTMFHWLNGNLLEIGYALLPAERGKGYCTEATQLVLDYLFLSKDIPRIQAATHVGNAASRKVLEKAGFKREGILRKATRSRGEWADLVIYSILRDEWEQPKILTKTA